MISQSYEPPVHDKNCANNSCYSATEREEIFLAIIGKSDWVTVSVN